MPTIRELREQAGWTQKELAGRVGAHPNTVARWERGEVTPDSRSQRLLEFVFGVTAGTVTQRPATEGRESDGR